MTNAQSRFNDNQSILPHLRLEPDDRSPWQLWLDDDEDHGYTAEFYDTWDREFRQRHLFSCPVNDWYDQLASDFDININ